MEAIATQDTFPLVALGVPEDMKQIFSCDSSSQVPAVNGASEMDLTKIESEFLREIFEEQTESNGLDDGTQESEWHFFLENLSPFTPPKCNHMEERGSQKEGGRSSGDSSLGEWDLLLDNLSQLETTVVQQILGHIESDILQGMLRYIHLRTIRDNSGGNHCEESIALPNKEVSLSNPPAEPFQEEPETMQSVHELDMPKQMDSNTKSLTKEIPIFEKQPGTMDWLRWSQERKSESKPQLFPSTCYFLTDIGEQAKWDPLGNSSCQVESKIEGTLQGSQQQLMPQKLLPALLSRISEQAESHEESIFKQLEQNLELQTQSGSLQGFKPVPQNLLPKLSQQGESDQEEVYAKLPLDAELEPESEPAFDELHTRQGLLNSDFNWTCQQIESKLAEIPSQIAPTLFMRTPLIMNSNVLGQLFRQIDKILFQVMPQHILFDAVHPKQIKAHVHWHVPPNCSLRIHVDDGLEYSELDQLEVLNPQHRGQFQSSEIRQSLRQAPQLNEFSGLGRIELDQMPWQGHRFLDCQGVVPNNHSCLNSSSLLSAVFEYCATVPNHSQLLPEFMLNSTTSESLRCRKVDAMSFICSHVGGETWNSQVIVSEPPSSTHPFLLDKLSQPGMTDDLSPPVINSDQNIAQLLSRTDELLSEISRGIHSNLHMCMGLPQEHQQQLQEHGASLADTDLPHLLPQSGIEFPFQQMDPVELHALRQKMCLTVLQEIAKQVEYNISQGLPLEINAGLLEALDLQPEDYWLQPFGQETEVNHDYCHHYPDESWDLQEVDTDSEVCPETSQQSENSNDFGELHEDMRQTLESSTSGWTTEPSETDSPLYYMADPVRQVYHRHYSHKDGNVDSLGLPIHGKFFDKLGEFLHSEGSHESALEADMPLYTQPLNILDDVRQYVDMGSRGDDLEDGFERSPDYMSSLNLLWVPEQELQQQSRVTQQEVDDEIGDTIDFYLEGLVGTTSDLIWFLDPDESRKSAAAFVEQEDVEANDLPYDLGVSGDLQVGEDLSGSSAEHTLDSDEAEELFLEGTDSGSRTFQFQESETSTTSREEAEQLQANAQLEEVCCNCCQPQLPEEAGLQDLHTVEPMRSAQRRKSVEWNPQIASILSISELGGNDSSPAPTLDQPNDGSATSNPPQRTRNALCDQGSEISEGPQMNETTSGRLSPPGSGSGKPRQTHTKSSNDEVQQQEGNSTDSPKVGSSLVKLTNDSTSPWPPTMSQFRDPSTPVRHTIFGLLVLAGGLYLLENREEIEQQSISAAEAAAQAWRWLGSVLIRIAKGEFDN